MPAPKQPNVQVRQPARDDTPTIETNDPVTNQAERQLAEEAQAEVDRRSEEEVARQEEEAAHQQELHDMRMDLMRAIVDSPEGFVPVEDGNREAVSAALAEGHVYLNNVQRGPGGLEVEERVFLADAGFGSLRSAFGPGLGKGKK